jgi:hypothetical protein
LAEHVKSAQMDLNPDQETPQASVQTNIMNNVMEFVPPTPGLDSRGSSADCHTPVVVELLHQVTPLLSEEPEAILTLFIWLDEIFDLGIVNDRVFITRILPLVAGSLLRFMGDCLQKGNSWAECKSQLLEEYFPYFVRERLVRDYIERVFRVAAFLKYGATEQPLVDSVVMNLHPSIPSQAAFLDRPKTRRDLDRMVGLMEEKSAVARERDSALHRSVP